MLCSNTISIQYIKCAHRRKKIQLAESDGWQVLHEHGHNALMHCKRQIKPNDLTTQDH